MALNIVVEGGASITLSDTDYVRSGGEADVYKKNGIAYKIYKDKTRMIPSAKVDELRRIQSDEVLFPDNIIFDDTGSPIGYTSRFIESPAVPVCKLFVRSFKRKNGISNDDINKLVKHIQDNIVIIHQANCLVVDLNEMNIIVGNNFEIPYFIDVGAYQTPTFKADAIMESIRDPLVKNNAWSEDSDWFSFGIIAFQLWIGIHPYKGTHPHYKKDWKKRMEVGASVFDHGVSLPKSTNDFSVIPRNYLDWLKKLFVTNERCGPPSVAGAVHLVVQSTPVGTYVGFSTKLVEELPEPIRFVYSLFGNHYVVTNNGVYVGSKKLPNHVRDCRKVFVCNSGQVHPVIAKLKDRNFISEDYQGNRISTGVADDAMTRNGCVYTIENDHVVERSYKYFGGRLIESRKIVANIMRSSTQVFDGIIFHSLAGRTHVVLPYEKGYACNVMLKELDEYRILDARSEGNVCVVVAEKNGQYDRLSFVFDKVPHYDLYKFEDVDVAEANFTVMPNNMIVFALQTEVELFKDNKKRVLQNPPFDTSMRIYNSAGKLFYVDDRKIFSCSMTQ